MSIQNTFFNSPIGIIEIKSKGDFISSVLYKHTIKSPGSENETVEITSSDHPLLMECQRQLQEYFDGQRQKFELPLQQEGSDFQQKIWAELINIPYGRTISYLELSKRIGNVKAIRAVGTANGQNSLSIIVPCHRVIGSNGDLTGYSGDLWRKKWLLDHEGKYANGVQTLF